MRTKAPRFSIIPKGDVILSLHQNIRKSILLNAFGCKQKSCPLVRSAFHHSLGFSFFRFTGDRSVSGPFGRDHLVGHSAIRFSSGCSFTRSSACSLVCVCGLFSRSSVCKVLFAIRGHKHAETVNLPVIKHCKPIGFHITLYLTFILVFFFIHCRDDQSSRL